MYPAHGVALFPPFPRDRRVFVAMSFDPRFDARWKTVIGPGIAGVRFEGKPLQPFRIDIPKTAGSIPADIVAAIAQSRLIFSDVTILDGHRNANVMYEVGIAHATRQPEEVLMFRSDREPLLFDIATVRINFYAPDEDPQQARALVADSIRAALREVEITRSATVKRIAESLDVGAVTMLLLLDAEAGLQHPRVRTTAETLGKSGAIAAISRLLELSLITAEWRAVGATDFLNAMKGATWESKFAEVIRKTVRYRQTALGEAVQKHFGGIVGDN